MPELPGHLTLRFAGLTFDHHTPYGYLFVGRTFAGDEVGVIVFNHTVAGDPGLRSTLDEAVRRIRATGQPLVHSADLAASPPWVAATGVAGARQLLASMAEAAGGGTVPQATGPTRHAPGTTRRSRRRGRRAPLEDPAFVDHSPLPPSPGRALGDYLLDDATVLAAVVLVAIVMLCGCLGLLATRV